MQFLEIENKNGSEDIYTKTGYNKLISNECNSILSFSTSKAIPIKVHL